MYVTSVIKYNLSIVHRPSCIVRSALLCLTPQPRSASAHSLDHDLHKGKSERPETPFYIMFKAVQIECRSARAVTIQRQLSGVGHKHEPPSDRSSPSKSLRQLHSYCAAPPIILGKLFHVSRPGPLKPPKPSSRSRMIFNAFLLLR
jgi:hypothetical protein